MNKAVFLDRDGVINLDYSNYHYRLEEFKLLPGIFDALKNLQQRGYLLIVVSNQGGIGKGLYKIEDTEKLHRYFLDECKKFDIVISEIYYCTHHPETSNCICRKPDSVLVEKAIARFNIDPSKSFFIGDRERDIEAGEKAGVKGILMEVNTMLINYLDLVL